MSCLSHRCSVSLLSKSQKMNTRRRRRGPAAVARPGRARSAPRPAAVSRSPPFVAARAPARRSSYSAANACGPGQLHLALGDVRPPSAHHVPVRRFRSRLRPFLRVTRHGQARGAPSWRAIPCTSAELMASTAAETLRWVPILCPYGSSDRDFDRCCVPPGHGAVRLELSSCLFLAAPSCPAFLRPPTRRLHDTGDHSAHKAHGFDRFLSSLNSPPSRRFAISAPSP